MKLLTVAFLAALSIGAAGCSGCQPIGKIADPASSLGAGQKVDEQAMAALDAAGTSANYLITAAANSGRLSRDQLLSAQTLRSNMDRAHAAAYTAYRAGDAKSYAEKIAAFNTLVRQANVLYEGVLAK